MNGDMGMNAIALVFIVEGEKVLCRFESAFIADVDDRIFFLDKDRIHHYQATVTHRIIDYRGGTIIAYLNVEDIEGPL